MLAYSLDLSLGLVLSPTPDFGSICHEKPMGARSGDFGNILVMLWDIKDILVLFSSNWCYINVEYSQK